MNPFTTLPKLMRSKPVIDQVQQEVKTMKLSNWKTTLLGLIAAGISLAQIWAPPALQPKIQATAVALAGVGLVAAKDHNS
jgi:hypothetical protein